MPLDPPRRFVVRGPYRVVRNPMMLGMGLLLGGQAMLYASKNIAIFLLIMVAVAHTFVCWVEEPQLERRFGASYTTYRRQVSRWMPRIPKRFRAR